MEFRRYKTYFPFEHFPSFQFQFFHGKAACVSYHVYANDTKDLFDKAIIMSGNMLNPWAFESDVGQCGLDLLGKLNIKSSAPMEELKAIDATDLILSTFSEELKKYFFGSEQFCFVPTVDDVFVSDQPHILTSRLNPPSNVPILIGITSLESEWIMSFDSNNYVYPNTNPNVTTFLSSFLPHIFGLNNDLMEDNDSFIRDFQVLVDMSYGIYKFLQNYVNSTKQKDVFLYRFAFDDRIDKNEENAATVHGAVHGDELKYIFLNDVEQHEHLPDRVSMTERMVTMWTNFIKFG